MSKRKVIAVLAAAVICICSSVGCNNSQNNAAVSDKSYKGEDIATQQIATNDKYSLLWDNDGKTVSLEDKATGKIWSNIPNEFYKSGKTSSKVSSTLNLTVANATTLKWDTLSGYQYAYKDGRILTEKIENGIKVTYCFDKYNISVPVDYVLKQDGVSVSVDTSKIIEGEDYLLISFSPAPFLCSANNSDDSYLFIPSGSGALMYTKQTVGGTREYQGDIYGIDMSRLFVEEPVDNIPLYMPVYGVKNGDEALFAIIENGAESASIKAETGNARTGYSSVCADFYVRGYDVFASNTQAWSFLDITRISDEIIKTDMSVLFVPLSGENADYNGMAHYYRNYLAENGKLRTVENKESFSSYAITFLGGLMTDSSTFGIPGKKLNTMTTLSEATAILKDIKEKTGEQPTVKLYGYGESGIDVGKIGGGYKIPSAFGKSRDYEELNDICKNNSKGLFVDFDIVRFSKSGSGFSHIFDSAKSATMHVAEKSPINNPLRDYNAELKYRLLKREDLFKAANKLDSFAEKKKISGISLSSLSSTAYSDYNNLKYGAKAGTESDVTGIFKSLTDKKKAVAVSDAFSYAAEIADVIFDAPVLGDQSDSLNVSVPFYQMIYGGSKPIYSTALNYSSNYKQHIMQSAVGGNALSLTLSNKFKPEYMYNHYDELYSTVYSSLPDVLIEQISSYKEFYGQIAGVKIDKYEMISDELSATYFENGIILYANHSDNKTESPLGMLSAYEIKWKG